jgi:hypothetical protein
MQTRKYRVECVDRDTGAKTFHVFDGVDAKAVTELANRMGFLVGEAVEVPTDQRRAFQWGVALASLILGVAIGVGGLFAAVTSGIAAIPSNGGSSTSTTMADGSEASPQTTTPRAAAKGDGEASRQLQKLADLPDVLSRLVAGETQWSLSVELDSKDHQLSDSKAECDRLGELLKTPPKTESDRLLSTHGAKLMELLASMTIVGGELIRFIPAISNDFNRTVSFASHNGQPCLIVSNMTTGMVYNTRKLASKERAAKVIQEAILPLLGDFDRLFNSTDIQSFAVVHFYGSKDFGSEEVLNTRGEVVCLVVNKRDLRDYLKTVITREELMRRSLVYLADRDSVFAFSRVELTVR